jgi:Zn-dependent M16 (insulinase) family peptidase
VQNDPHKGTFTIYSYRDPNHLKTYGIYEKCINKVADRQFNEKDLNESKLSAFQKIDRPVAPSSKGLGQFLYGTT